MRIFPLSMLPAMLISLAACSAQPPASTPASPEAPAAAASPEDHSEENFRNYLAQCQRDYEASDARILAAGVHDAEYAPVAGFPYLRTDRLMASYRDEVSGNIDKLGIWMLQLREYDSIAREVELTNLGLSRTDRADELYRLRTCAVWMSDAATSNPGTLKQLLQAVRTPELDDAAVLEPTRRAVEARRARIRAEFATPLPTARGERVWRVAPDKSNAAAPENLNKARRDELGRVGLIISQWPALAAKFAPRLVVKGTEDEQPAAPVWTEHGLTADPAQPVVYYLASYARVDARMLVQFNYFVWFRSASKAETGEPPLDGLIWRVTLDEDGRRVLAYDTIKIRGGEHLWFPDAALQLRNPQASDAPLIPQRLSAGGDFDVWLTARTHDVQRLADSRQARGIRTGSYTLRPYEDLLTLSLPGGGARSLFGPDGLVPGSRPPSTASAAEVGIGALRRWGDQRSSPLMTRYFDDPHLLETLFVVPERAPSLELTRTP